MIESIAAISRWAQLVANLVLFGSCIFLLMASSQNSIFKYPWVAKLEMLFPKLSIVVLIGLVGILATTTGQATGIPSDAWQPMVWFEIVKETRMGHLWVARAISAVIMLLVFIYILRLHRTKWHYLLGAIVAALPLIAGSLVSHSAAEEISFVSIFPYSLHILLAGAWFGALPAFLLHALASRNLSEIWHPSYFIAYGGGSLLLFVCAFVLYRHYFQHRLTASAVMAMGASMSNTGFIGTAILTMLIGQHAAIYISLT